MKRQLMTQVTNSIFEVMETMFFLTLEKENNPQNKKNTEMKTAAISFSGDIQGSIFIEIPLSLLKTMTENFMGQDMDSLSTDYIEGTLKEALNMVAGNALTKVDKTSYMGLGIPEIVSSPGSGDIDETVVLSTGRENLLAHIRLN